MFDKDLIQSFHEGQCLNAYDLFGAHVVTENGEVKGEFKTSKKLPNVFDKIKSRGIEEIDNIFE